jgi:hypothetical protein
LSVSFLNLQCAERKCCMLNKKLSKFTFIIIINKSSFVWRIHLHGFHQLYNETI